MGSHETLELGNLEVQRDWGWAPEYVEAMWRMMQNDEPGDFVIATGKTHTLEEFVQAAFSSVGLEWREHVSSEPGLFRTTDISSSRADPARAHDVLG